MKLISQPIVLLHACFNTIALTSAIHNYSLVREFVDVELLVSDWCRLRWDGHLQWVTPLSTFTLQDVSGLGTHLVRRENLDIIIITMSYSALDLSFT